MDITERRAILVRARARKFAGHVRANPGLAFGLPEDVVDWLGDDEVPTFFAHLRTFRLQQRKDDMKWEVAP